MEQNENDEVAQDSLFATDQFNETGGENGDESGEDGDLGDSEPLREQDRFLPIANVARIMKKTIPKSGKISKEAKDCVQECVSEFVSFITSEASERCQQEKRKTINGEDLLFAMATLGFDNYVDPLKIYLQKFRESTKGEKILSPGQVDAHMEDLGVTSQETFTTIGGSLLSEDKPPARIIYTTIQAADSREITGQQLNL